MGEYINMIRGVEKGVEYPSRFSGNFIVKSIRGWDNVEVEFCKTGFTKLVRSSHVLTGNIKDPYYPRYYGVGYLGEGKFKTYKEHTSHHDVWKGMLDRCYNKERLDTKTYKDVEVCKSWWNYQVFAEWFDCNNVKGYHLDKDLKFVGNKIYSPENCIFVPSKVNALLTGGLVNGVFYDKNRSKWVAQCHNGFRQINLGRHCSYEEALMSYKNFKLSRVKDLKVEFPDLPDYIWTNIEYIINKLGGMVFDERKMIEHPYEDAEIIKFTPADCCRVGWTQHISKVFEDDGVW